MVRHLGVGQIILTMLQDQYLLSMATLSHCPVTTPNDLPLALPGWPCSGFPCWTSAAPRSSLPREHQITIWHSAENTSRARHLQWFETPAGICTQKKTGWTTQPVRLPAVPRDAVSTWRLTPRVILISRANPVKYIYISCWDNVKNPEAGTPIKSRIFFKRLLHKDNIYFIPRKMWFQPDGSHHSHHEWFKESLF